MRGRSVRGVERPTLKHRDFLRGSIRCSFTTVAGALSFLHQGGVDRISYLVPLLEGPNGKEPSRVGHILPPTGAPLTKTPTRCADPAPSSRTLVHVHQESSLPVEQVEEPTLRDGPVVTPRRPARSAGLYSRKSTGELHLSSSRSSLESPAPSDAVEALFLQFFAKERM